MSLYQEQTIRKTKGESIKTMVVEKVPEHRTWVEVVFNVVRYLVVNGMPIRGHSENADFQSDSAEGGIYINTFTYLLFKADPKLKDIAKRLPANAKYMSSDIQNDVIDALYNVAKSKIANKIRKAELYTVMLDGSTDTTANELVGIVARYVDDDTLKVDEHVVDIKDATDDKSALGIIQLLESTL